MALARNILLAFLVVVMPLLLIATWLLYPAAGHRLVSAATVDSIRGEGISTCVSRVVPVEYQRGCFEAEMLELLQQEGPRAAPMLSEFAEAEPRLGPTCHVLMHSVAPRYARSKGITLESFSRWSPPDGLDENCSAGYVHGLLQELADTARTPTAAVAAADACDAAREGGPWSRKLCIHGLGHAFMRAAGGTPDDALVLCGSLGSSRVECSSGAFHEVWFQRQGTEGAADAAAAPRDMRGYCRTVDDDYQSSCWVRAFQQEGLPEAATPPAMIKMACGRFSGMVADGCVVGASYRLAQQQAVPTDELAAACADLPDAWYAACVQPLALFVDGGGKAIRLCGREGDAQLQCLERTAHAHAVYSSSRLHECGRLMAAERAACTRGSDRIDEPLGIT